MTLKELRQACSGQKYIYLTLPRDTLPKGERVRLLGKSGPMGRLCTVNQPEDGRFNVVAVFETKKIMEFLDDQNDPEI